jgi:hypothetical protein
MFASSFTDCIKLLLLSLSPFPFVSAQRIKLLSLSLSLIHLLPICGSTPTVQGRVEAGSAL